MASPRSTVNERNSSKIKWGKQVEKNSDFKTKTNS